MTEPSRATYTICPTLTRFVQRSLAALYVGINWLSAGEPFRQ